MSALAEQPQNPVVSLNRTYLISYPVEAAHRLESLDPKAIVGLISELPEDSAARVLEKVTPGALESIIRAMEETVAARIIAALRISISIPLLSRLDKKTRDHYLGLMDPGIADELHTLLDYPANSAGRMMNPRIIAFKQSATVGQTLDQLRQQGIDTIRHLFLLDDELRLQAQVDVRRLPLADRQKSLNGLSMPIVSFVHAMDPKDEVIDKLEAHHVDVLPVVDVDHRLVGAIQGQGIFDVVREDLATNLQTMVGASKDERALSSSWFAVRKRLPWLQINLLTAFMAAAVVGLFEATIAQFTALAVLLPIAAGQSGNTGAQALAVTMRGLTLREITLRDWFRVVSKELVAGLTNGIGIAAVCAGGVYLWSNSSGLALVMALSMVISMTIAGVAGALVPIVLQRLGQDPAQSSSIVLTTVTDITGFMAFLGIATLLSGMLVAS